MDPQKMFSGAATCEDVMQCFFNLNEFEVNLYLKLVKKGPETSEDLSKALKKDRTTVYRSLQKLISCGICFRETKTLKRGGYYHVYTAVSPEILYKKLQDCVEIWNSSMRKAMEEFEERFLE